jgi:hypothetical protein
MSPSDRVAVLYPQALVSLFVTFRNHGGSILHYLHSGNEKMLWGIHEETYRKEVIQM